MLDKSGLTGLPRSLCWAFCASSPEISTETGISRPADPVFHAVSRHIMPFKEPEFLNFRIERPLCTGMGTRESPGALQPFRGNGRAACNGVDVPFCKKMCNAEVKARCYTTY
jgi:hypothetical protein